MGVILVPCTLIAQRPAGAPAGTTEKCKDGTSTTAPKNRARAEDTKESIPGTRAKPLPQRLQPQLPQARPPVRELLKIRKPPTQRPVFRALPRQAPRQLRLLLQVAALDLSGSIPQAMLITGLCWPLLVGRSPLLEIPVRPLTSLWDYLRYLCESLDSRNTEGDELGRIRRVTSSRGRGARCESAAALIGDWLSSGVLLPARREHTSTIWGLSKDIAGRDALSEEGCIHSIAHPDPQR